MKVLAVVGSTIDPLLSLLTRFFSAYGVPPALYGRVDQLADPALLESARALGAATAALAAAVGAGGALAAQRPQA